MRKMREMVTLFAIDEQKEREVSGVEEEKPTTVPFHRFASRNEI